MTNCSYFDVLSGKHKVQNYLVCPKRFSQKDKVRTDRIFGRSYCTWDNAG